MAVCAPTPRCLLSSLAWRALVVFLLLASSLASASPQKSAPARASTSVELQGVSYVTTTEVARLLGFKQSWVAAGKRVALVKDGSRAELEVDTREAKVNGLRVLLCEPVRMYRRSLYISRIDAERFIGPMMNPAVVRHSPGPVRVIALDAGHGGRDTGKVNERLKVSEKTFTLDVVQRTKKLLEASGFKVVLTRSDDRFIELDDRPALAKKLGADVFVSVHFNSVESRPTQVTGIEVFTLTPQHQFSTDDHARSARDQARVFNPGNATDEWNSLLGYCLHKQLVTDLKAPDRGHKRQRFKVLRLAQCPAVLVEAGYLSNDSEAAKIATPAYRQDIAESLARGLSAYAAAVKSAK